jgi:hypothetical protein
MVRRVGAYPGGELKLAAGSRVVPADCTEELRHEAIALWYGARLRDHWL